ncbi:hypothetical protein GWK47_019916 [Chionoecetes opilio]|uniref:Uncharacterized protein n=1 Tax=Chionoecetes opilio TaxID=41210 RepID=A0A8J4XQ35_CHIOP|nr:hypothetical protein GWK47_019916 [Chionoecetes opilio]
MSTSTLAQGPHLRHVSDQLHGVPASTTLPHTPHLSSTKYMNVPLSPYPSSSSAPTSSKGTQLSSVYITATLIVVWHCRRSEDSFQRQRMLKRLSDRFQDPQTPNSRPSPAMCKMTSHFIKKCTCNQPLQWISAGKLCNQLASYAGQQPIKSFCPFLPSILWYEKSFRQSYTQDA